ncbi:MAG TPA: TonB dependent receptor [Longimicrobiales bacterium]|nr:TonB dependent receptor [Longimicrobiales bacterium]
MRRIDTAVLLAAFMAFGGQAAAQVSAGEAGEVVGSVVDGSSLRPLPSASVAVYAERDSALAGGTLTGPGGRFRVPGLAPGRYSVTITYLGYRQRTLSPVVIAASEPRTDLGAVALSTQAVALEGISVTAERSAVAMRVDRTVYEADKLPSSSGGNISDALQNVPAVEVDADGNVSLHGNQNVTIQINGRSTPLSGEALADFLRQLPASVVQRIEVVPNPSAKHDPEGTGGILNLVLKKDADLGFSGGIDVGAATRGRYNASARFGYQRGPLNLSGNYGVHGDRRENDGSSWRENLFDDPITYLGQQTSGARDSNGHVLHLNADYHLGERDVVSASAMGRISGAVRRSAVHDRLLDAAQELTGRFEQDNRTEADRLGTDLALSYEHTFTPEKHALSAEVRYEYDRDSDDRRLLRRSLTAAGEPGADPEELEVNGTDDHSLETTLRLDYTRALGGAWKLEAGYKGRLLDLDSDYDVESFEGGVPVPDARGNAFRYDRGVHAVYATLGRQLGAIGLQAGLRLEDASTTFDLRTTGESYRDDYAELYPSASALWKASDSRQLRLSYSKRVHRPGAWALNPFPATDDPLNREAGNPFLRPEYTHACQLELQQYLSFGSLQLSPFYRRTTDVIRSVTTLEPATGISTRTPQNLATSTAYGADVTASFRLDDALRGFASGSAYRRRTDGENIGAGLSSDAVTWSLRGSVNWTVRPGTELSWFSMYRAPRKVEQGRIAAFSMSSFSVRQQLWNDRTSLTLRVSDPFDTMRWESRVATDDYLQVSERDLDARALFVSFRWSFGQKPELHDPEGGDRTGGPAGAEPGS